MRRNQIIQRREERHTTSLSDFSASKSTNWQTSNQQPAPSRQAVASTLSSIISSGGAVVVVVVGFVSLFLPQNELQKTAETRSARVYESTIIIPHIYKVLWCCTYLERHLPQPTTCCRTAAGRALSKRLFHVMGVPISISFAGDDDWRVKASKVDERR